MRACIGANCGECEPGQSANGRRRGYALTWDTRIAHGERERPGRSHHPAEASLAGRSDSHTFQSAPHVFVVRFIVNLNARCVPM
eukprot:5375781-Prymnesium_polylepis.1